MAARTSPICTKLFSPREREESDLLLKLVLTHLEFSRSSEPQTREQAHERFVQAVRELYLLISA